MIILFQKVGYFAFYGCPKSTIIKTFRVFSYKVKDCYISKSAGADFRGNVIDDVNFLSTTAGCGV